MVRVGDGRLNFYEQEPRDLGRNAIHHLGIQIDGLSELAERLIEAGLTKPNSVRVLPELDYLMVEAPDGVLLELFEWKAGEGADPGATEWFDWPTH